MRPKKKKIQDDNTELDEMGGGTLTEKAEGISDSHNRKSQSALQRNQIRGFC